MNTVRTLHPRSLCIFGHVNHKIKGLDRSGAARNCFPLTCTTYSMQLTNDCQLVSLRTVPFVYQILFTKVRDILTNKRAASFKRNSGTFELNFSLTAILF
jgi:hypothetical protein